MKVFLAAKLHRLRVTDANVDYAGSVAVDEEILKAAGLEPYERVQLNNFSNGRTWTTYIIPAPPGSRAFCLNGGAARFGVTGDIVAALTYRLSETFVPARVVVLDEDNRIERVRVYGAEEAGAEVLPNFEEVRPGI
jgi:aspartate 1-decarboxylase